MTLADPNDAPANPFSGIGRDPRQPKSHDLRWHQVRTENLIEARPNRAFWAQSTYWTHLEDGTPIDGGSQVALPSTEGAAAWGPPMRVIGWDRIALLLAVLEVAGTSVIHVVAQVSQINKENPAGNPGADSHWFDWFEESLTPTRAEYILPAAVAGGTTRRAWNVDHPIGYYVRFKIWGVGADANTRALLQASRIMDAV